MTRGLIVIFLAAGLIVPPKQDAAHTDLASRLADALTRRSAVAEVVRAPRLYIPILLAWTKNPPPGIFQEELYVGMAQAFGELKTREAIPFLIANISLGVFRKPNVWMKEAAVAEANLPSVAALVKIGPEASNALIRTYYGPMTPEARLAAILAVARIGDPAARPFLASAVGMGSTQVQWAKEGLKVLDARR